MSRLRRGVHRVALGAEAGFDKLARLMGTRFAGNEPVRVQLYYGYGTSEEVHVSGRVLAQPPLARATDSDSLWRNIVHMYRRLETDEVPGARVRVHCGGSTVDVVADEEAYFHARVAPRTLPENGPWHRTEAELLEPLRPRSPPARAAGRVLVPPAAARFGVISDLDDTVIQTGAASLLRMARTVVLGNARTRLPFKGVAAFYEALQRGGSERPMNPIFYVSSSPWNLYDLLVDFLEINRIPAGPLMLRDWGISETEVLPTSHAAHKLEAIRQILDTYPALPFLLIGDSGQEDPEIYRDVIREFPRRILAAYIRNVSPDPLRHDAIAALAREVVEAGSTLILAEDTIAAARHGSESGWISPADLPAILEEKRADDSGAVKESSAPAYAAAVPPVIVDASREPKR